MTTAAQHSSSEDEPVLTILMPVRNEAAFLKSCLASIEPPSGLLCEIVLVDDGSEDESAAIAADFAAGSAIPMQVIRNGHRGKAAALNLAFLAARGDAFIFFAGDDLLVGSALPARLAAVTAGMTARSPCVAQCRYRSFSDTHPGLAGILFPRPGMEDHIAGGAVSFNRAFAGRYFPIPEQLPNEDSWLRALAIALDLQVVPLDCLGLHYRIHAGNSVGPLRSFAEADRNLRERNAAYALALERFDREITASGRRRLEAIIRAEELRSRGRWLALLFIGGLSRIDRAMMLANSTPWLYALKARLLPKLRHWIRRRV